MTVLQPAEPPPAAAPPLPPNWNPHRHRLAFWFYTFGLLCFVVSLCVETTSPNWVQIIALAVLVLLEPHWYLNAYHPHIWPWRNRPLWRSRR